MINKVIGRKISKGKCIERDKYLLDLCIDKHVLHVGCTDTPFYTEKRQSSSLLHQKLCEVAKSCIGVDCASEEINMMEKDGFNVVDCDAKKMRRNFQKEKFEVVLLADIIEHDTCPGMIIEEAKFLLAKNGVIVLSVPNAFGIVRFFKTIFRYEQVHRDHMAYYSSSTLQALSERYDLVVVNNNWYRFELSEKRFLIYLGVFIERIFTSFAPWYGEGCMVELRINQ